jgi:hypothetical protein
MSLLLSSAAVVLIAAPAIANSVDLASVSSLAAVALPDSDSCLPAFDLQPAENHEVVHHAERGTRDYAATKPQALA